MEVVASRRSKPDTAERMPSSSMAQQNQPYEARCPNGRLLIRKRTLPAASPKDRIWPISVLQIQIEIMPRASILLQN